MLRASAALIFAIVLLSSCGDDIHSKQKVEAAIRDRLQNKSGLDLKTLDVDTTNVTFDKNLAYATVSFHPKGDTRVDSGMVMKYTLEDRDNKWVVTKVGDTSGHAISGHGGMGSVGGQAVLPPGHPQIGDKQ